MSNATRQALAQSLPKSYQVLLLPVPPDDKIETANEIANMSWRQARKWIKQKYPFVGSCVDDIWDWL